MVIPQLAIHIDGVENTDFVKVLQIISTNLVLINSLNFGLHGGSEKSRCMYSATVVETIIKKWKQSYRVNQYQTERMNGRAVFHCIGSTLTLIFSGLYNT